MASGTSYEFSLPSVQPIRMLDETGLSSNAGTSNGKACVPTKKPSISTHVPQSVMLGSLLEHLCDLYERDSEKSQSIFKEICKRLVSLQIISPVAYLEEYATVRHQYKSSFYSLIKSSLSTLDPKLPLPSTDEIPSDKQQNSFEPALFNLNVSRYSEEFEEVSKLGKGAYGMVCKARNKVDGQYYAIKKVHIKDTTQQSNRMQIDRIMREVQFLAAMQHGNIVRYHNAWMEHRTVIAEEDISETNSYLSQSTSRRNNFSNVEQSLGFEFKSSRGNSNFESDVSSLHMSKGGKFWNNSSSDSDSDDQSGSFSQDDSLSDEETGLQFQADDNLSPADCDKVIYTHGVQKEHMRRTQSFVVVSSNSSPWSSNRHRMHSFSDLQKVAVVQNSFTEHVDSVAHVYSPRDEIVLYIQMQLCETSLTHWLRDRNSQINSNATISDMCNVVDEIMSLDILRQILQALAYVHAKGMMHRDVKPRNILLNGKRPQVLLGDFGLARSALLKQNSMNLSPLNDVTNFLQMEQTTGVGTMIYAAPEQLEGANYGTKADMYAVGIVLFELFWPVETQHERVQSISELRKASIPKDFAQKWPKYVPTLKSLLSHDPADRPTAQQVLDSDIFQVNTCEGFFEKYADLKEENASLKEQISMYKRKMEELGIDFR